MKKAFEIFYISNKNMSEKSYKVLIKRVLRSYQMQVNMGITQISAFENSLLNPTKAKSVSMKRRELEIIHSSIKQKSQKLNKLFLYQKELNLWISEGVSMRKIKCLLWELHHFRCSHETIRKYVKMTFEEGKLTKN